MGAGFSANEKHHRLTTRQRWPPTTTPFSGIEYVKRTKTTHPEDTFCKNYPGFTHLPEKEGNASDIFAV
jgi:hypothetical protein